MAHWRPRMPKPVCPSCGQDRAIRRGGGLCLSCDKQLSAVPQFDRICPDCGDVIYADRRACECQSDLYVHDSRPVPWNVRPSSFKCPK